jgi:hypothetical protein
VAQRAHGVFVSRLPMFFHRLTRELKILGIPLVIPSAVNQMDDVVEVSATITGELLRLNLSLYDVAKRVLIPTSPPSSVGKEVLGDGLRDVLGVQLMLSGAFCILIR